MTWYSDEAARQAREHFKRQSPLCKETVRRMSRALGRGRLHLMAALSQDERRHINGRDRHGNTMLYTAVHNFDRPAVEWLVQQGADPNVKGSKGTPLMAAADNGDVQLATFLLDNGASVFERVGWGVTALHRAASSSSGSVDMVELLLSRGDHVDRGDSWCYSTLMIAVSRRPLQAAYDIIKYLLQRGACVNRCNKKGQTALMLACKKWDGPVVSLLLDHGADVNIQDDSGATALTMMLAQPALPSDLKECAVFEKIVPM